MKNKQLIRVKTKEDNDFIEVDTKKYVLNLMDKFNPKSRFMEGIRKKGITLLENRNFLISVGILASTTGTPGCPECDKKLDDKTCRLIEWWE